MSTALPFKRLAVMLAVALPVGALGLAGWRTIVGDAGSFVNNLGGAIVLIYFWGAVTGGLLSLVHTRFTHASRPRSLIGALLLGLVSGAAVGALTPTFLTGFFYPPAAQIGAGVGVVYFSVLRVLPRLSHGEGGAA